MRTPSEILRDKEAARKTITPAEQHEAKQLMDRSLAAGATLISEAELGVVVTVAGTIRSITLRPATDTMLFEVDLYDGSSHLTLAWLGRRRIAALNVGRLVVAHGRITDLRGRRCIFNPAYELMAN